MTFEEWWEKKSPYMPHLMDDFEDWPSEWKVKQLAKEAFQEGLDHAQEEARKEYARLRGLPF